LKKFKHVAMWSNQTDSSFIAKFICLLRD